MKLFFSSGLLMLTLIILFPTARASEASCSAVDLRPKFGPVRTQQSAGWCYAFSLADLLGQRLGVEPPKMISARDIAISLVSYNEADAQRIDLKTVKGLNARTAPYDGQRMNQRSAAHAFEAFATYSARGRMCFESQLPSQGLNYNSQWINKSVKEVYEKYELTSHSVQPYSAPADDLAQCYSVKAPDIRLVQFQRQVNNWATARIREEADATCPETEQLKGLAPTQTFRSEEVSREAVMAAGVAALDNGNGFIIDYDVNPFKKPLAIKGPEELPSAYEVNRSSGGRYVSVVVGRRWNDSKKTCELLVRNSWGPSCASYRSDVDCTDGHFWAAQEELTQNLHSVFKF